MAKSKRIGIIKRVVLWWSDGAVVRWYGAVVLFSDG